MRLFGCEYRTQILLILSKSNEIYIEPFGIENGSLEMKLIDLKSKALWIINRMERKLKELEVQKCIYVTQQKLTALKEMTRVEAHIRLME
ncbi:hypothetical protein TNCV_577591 [Trichonephila clavipes]|nr:hypothetical protein TNCV_577591 [Trichonephila clavipes]